MSSCSSRSSDEEIRDDDLEDSIRSEEEEEEIGLPLEEEPPDYASLIIPQEKSKKKPGIIYLSSIPPGFNVSRTTAFFADFGKVGRVFLQPDLKDKKSEKNRTFVEGWIEFASKRVAQEVAENLNSSQVGGKKRSKAHDVIWNIKYLPRFKWSHLTERLNYEKAVYHQKMRSEIAQAKREADFYKSGLDVSKRMKKDNRAPNRTYEFRLKDTDESIRSKRKRRRSSRENEDDEDEKPSSHSSKKSKSDNAPFASSPGASSKKGKKNKGKGKSSMNRSDFLRSVFGGTN